jgi:hypothetical protein
MNAERMRQLSYVMVGLAISILIAISPFIASWISNYHLNWPKLSNVGGSYGPVSSILSGAALIGIVVTVALQRKQTNAATEQSVRQMQLDLMQIAWEDPSLIRALENIPKGHEELAKQSVFLNMYFMYLRMGYRSGQVSRDEIFDLATEHFSTDAGTYYWKGSRGHMRRHFEAGFVTALEEAFEKSQREPTSMFLDWRPPSANRQSDAATPAGE